MIRLRRLLVAAPTVLAMACGGEGSDVSSRGVQVVTADSAGIEVVTISGPVGELPVWTLSDAPVAEIRGDEPPFLSRVGEVEFLSDGRLLIEDNQSAELRLFTAAGVETRLLGRRGDGPGEFQNLMELSVADGDGIVAYDRRHYRISRLDTGGSPVASVLVGREWAGSGSLVLDAWPLGPAGYLLHSLGREEVEWLETPHRDSREAVLHRVDAEGAQVGDPVHFPGGYSIRGEHGDAASPFANTPFVSVHGDRVVYGSGVGYELVVTDEELRPVRVIRWGGWQQPLTDGELGAVRDTAERDLLPIRERAPQAADQFMAAMFDPALLPDTLPALSRALIAPDGALWVMGFRTTIHWWDETDRWHVLDPSGTPLARLTLPPDARLMAVAPDRVALAVRDSLDVEHVRVLTIERGESDR